MGQKEKVFLLEWGYSQVKLVYADYDSNHEIITIDAKALSNNGSLIDNEKDLSKVEKILSELIDYFEEKYCL